MILVPGWLWQRGPVARGVGAGLAVGAFSAAFVLLEAQAWLGAAAAFVVLSLFYGIRAARRMARIWPEAKGMSRADRAAVVSATRSGEAVADPRLAPAVVAYAGALRRSAENDRLGHRIVLLVTVLAVVLAVYDTLRSTPGEMIASWLVVALLLADLVWWPRRRAALLARADRAAATARAMPDAG
ncbi:hypothetical protein [Streptomyces sp. NPDC127190]|uniref:hypothetical protein n=1 Tax=unclassified Streptomyces TaxID=2593676 RepID=UPI00363DCC0C